jgi:hypothetical protein
VLLLPFVLSGCLTGPNDEEIRQITRQAFRNQGSIEAIEINGKSACQAFERDEDNHIDNRWLVSVTLHFADRPWEERESFYIIRQSEAWTYDTRSDPDDCVFR